MVVGIQLLQWGVEKLRGRVPKYEGERLPFLQVTNWFGQVILRYLSTTESANQRREFGITSLLLLSVYRLLVIGSLKVINMFCTSLFFFLLFRSFSSASWRSWISPSEAGVKRLKTSVPTGGSRDAILPFCIAARTSLSASSLPLWREEEQFQSRNAGRKRTDGILPSALRDTPNRTKSQVSSLLL